MRPILVLFLILFAGFFLSACAPEPTAAGVEPALESSMRTQVVAEITMTAAQNALDSARATSAAAQKTLEAPTLTPIVPTTTLPPSAPARLVATVSVTKMELRDGPDLRFGAVADCFTGESVFLIAKYHQWVYVELKNGLKGWAYYEWLKFPPGIELDDIPDAVSVPNLIIPRKYP